MLNVKAAVATLYRVIKINYIKLKFCLNTNMLVACPRWVLIPFSNIVSPWYHRQPVVALRSCDGARRPDGCYHLKEYKN